jgi:hypothetical protein
VTETIITARTPEVSCPARERHAAEHFPIENVSFVDLQLLELLDMPRPLPGETQSAPDPLDGAAETNNSKRRGIRQAKRAPKGCLPAAS